MKKWVREAFKSVIVLAAASVVFIMALIFFTLTGSIASGSFTLGRMITDDFYLLLTLLAVSIPLGILIAPLAVSVNRKHLFWLLTFALVVYWFVILLSIFLMSKFSLNGKDLAEVFQLSVWAMLAYSYFAVPIMLLSVFLLARWTKKK